jgi:hypothetical protein
MQSKIPSPGVSRSSRLTDEGLKRLERQLKAGVKLSPAVLEQWVRRYGEPAREIIESNRRRSV